MIEWKKSARGVYRYSNGAATADVWSLPPGFHWTLMDDTTGCYVTYGHAATLDEACEEALKAMKI